VDQDEGQDHDPDDDRDRLPDPADEVPRHEAGLV
jgi:hypothetical protein